MTRRFAFYQMFLVSSCPRIVLVFCSILYNATEQPGWNWLSLVGSLDSDPLGNVAPHCRHLQCIRWTGPQGVFGLGGIDYLTVGINFRNFYIDDSRLAAHLRRPLFYKRTGFVSFGSCLSKVYNGWAFEMSLATTEMIPVPLLNHCHRTAISHAYQNGAFVVMQPYVGSGATFGKIMLLSCYNVRATRHCFCWELDAAK